MDFARLRARIQAIRFFINDLPQERDEKNPDRVLLRNGFVPENMQIKFDEMVSDLEKKNTNEPLAFKELTLFNTWFNLHPEKICGIEYVTTSWEFPIAVKGTMEDIYNTIHQSKDTDKLKRVRIARAKAKAIILLSI